MPNDFDAAWSASWESQHQPTGESATLNGQAVTVVVLELDRVGRIGQLGGVGANITGEIELSRAQWIEVGGAAGSKLLLRGRYYEILDDPTDSEDSGTVVLRLTNLGGSN